MEENKKGAYLSKVDDFAKEMSEMAASEHEGVKRGLIVLAAEEIKGEDGIKSTITVSGNGEKLAELVAIFATQDETRQIVSRGLKLSVMKTIKEQIEGDFNN